LNAAPKSVTTEAATGAAIVPVIAHPVLVMLLPVVPTSPSTVLVVQVTVPLVGTLLVPSSV
jgi:hypothetical protein